MYRVVAGITLALACGRIRFDPVPAGGSGAPGDSALVVNDGGVAVGCGFIPCDAGATACCIAEQTSCVPDGTCGGVSYGCGPCGKFEACCRFLDGGSVCQPTCPIPP
jgi:hypothetical protein